MKVAVSSSGKDLDSQIDPRFGRCAYFLIVDTDNMNYEAFENGNAMLSGGAGIQSAQFVASKDAKAVITGNCGPNAVKTLSAAGVQLFAGQSGTVRECVERFKNKALNQTQKANVPDHFGMKEYNTQSQPSGKNMGVGRLSGRGMGRGGGRGGGRGMGRGMGMVQGNESNQSILNDLPKDKELSLLKNQSNELKRQLEEIQAQIKRLEKSD